MKDLGSELLELVKQDSAYPVGAYILIYEVLDWMKDNGLVKQGEHITGQGLAITIIAYAIQHYGLLTEAILKELGITKSEDVGNIVWNLVEANLIGKQPNDSRQDFAKVFDSTIFGKIRLVFTSSERRDVTMQPMLEEV